MTIVGGIFPHTLSEQVEGPHVAGAEPFYPMQNLLFFPRGELIFGKTIADLQSGEGAGRFPEDVQFSRAPRCLHAEGVVFGEKGVLFGKVFDLPPASAF
eukprot:13028317-Heterocapsa_arctica.AAC.1